MIPVHLSNLKAALRDFRHALANGAIERDDAGAIRVQRSSLLAKGVYNFRVNGGPWSEDVPNLLPTEGLIYLLNLLGNHASILSLYIALYATAISPSAGHTGASFTATYGEITSGTEGYTESTRVAWTTATASGTAVLNNYASPSTFTINTASTLAVEGVGMLTTSAKGDTTGKLVSATRFPATRNFSDEDTFDVKYQIGLSST